MNHKRKRPKHQRAGCLCCKPHKDERAAQSAPAVTEHVDPRPPGRRRKNRRRWCKGVAGVAHQARWFDRRSTKWWLSYECVNCHKVLDICGEGWSESTRGRFKALLQENGFPTTWVTAYGHQRSV